MKEKFRKFRRNMVSAFVILALLFNSTMVWGAAGNAVDFQISYTNGHAPKEIVIYKGYYANPLIISKKAGYNSYLGKINFKMANPKIASVDKDGRIKALSVGTTTYRATLKSNSKSYLECKIRVMERPKGINAAKIYAPNETVPILKDYSGFNALCSNYFTYIDKEKNLNVVSVVRVLDGIVDQRQQAHDSELIIHTYNKNYKLLKTKKVPIDFKKVGGFCAGEDGNLYVALGNENKEMNDNKVVLAILQFNSNWEEIGRCEFQASATGSIYETTQTKNLYIQNMFDTSNCSMALQKNMLVVHTAREIYSENHQSNLTFKIDTKTMKQIGSDYDTGNLFSASHSFRQLAAFDQDRLILIDQSDGFPGRGTLIQTQNNVFQAASAKDVRDQTTLQNAMPYSGAYGDNTTNVKIGGFEVGKYNNLIAGASMLHTDFTNKPAVAADYSNAYLLVVPKDGSSTKIVWLTDHTAGSKNMVWGTKLIKLTDDKFVVVYSKHHYSSYVGSEYALVDSNGTILKQGALNEDVAHNGCKPILFNGKCVWLVENNAGGTEGRFYGDKRTNYFYELQVK